MHVRSGTWTCICRDQVNLAPPIARLNLGDTSQNLVARGLLTEEDSSTRFERGLHCGSEDAPELNSGSLAEQCTLSFVRKARSVADHLRAVGRQRADVKNDLTKSREIQSWQD